MRLITTGGASPQSRDGEHLSSEQVSSLPLNARDFAAGTMTDANGAANFAQQFAVNGQRGSATVFAIDDTTEPEMGDATFSNFNLSNLVNFGLPSNITRGSEYGIISKTARSSRQIQFSMKLIH